MDYRAFVREKMAEMRGKPISQQEKMKEIGRMWRGRKPSKGKQHPKGKGMNLTGGGDVIELDNGVLLHPDMIGEGFWSDVGRGKQRCQFRRQGRHFTRRQGSDGSRTSHSLERKVCIFC